MDTFPGGIFLNGTVGVGKTTVAVYVGKALQRLGIAHAIIDLDAIRHAWPAPAALTKYARNWQLERTNSALGLGNAALSSSHPTLRLCQVFRP
ncbi:adenylylsulfate kinase-like enzyme [Paenarthrobacter nitroguajacolicus]|nr:adenylyl-sulfate kinase [Paenarthrobacter nitroguajacolicus]MDR6989252.1 adenylylsulfate kinase-like enzyme [Paenarthrobacter nitroguajacolicus]